METQASFLAAQAAALSRHGLTPRRFFVDVPVVRGRAQVLSFGHGPPAVLLNGIGTPGAMWAPLIARLDGLTLHAVDLPGFGLTDTTVAAARDPRATAVAFLTEVLDGLGLDRPAIIGNSLGSHWAMRFALARPDRVRAMVHIGCPALILDTSAPLPMRLMGTRGLGWVLMRVAGPSERQVEELSRMVGEAPLPQEVAALLLATERLPHFEPTFLAMLNALIGLRGARPGMALDQALLGRIATPTQLIFANGDPFGSPDVARTAAAALPDAQMRVVDGGHAPWLHHADQIAPLVLDFLTPSRVARASA